MTRNADGGILGARCLVYMETYVLVDFIDSIDGVGPHHFIIFSKISSSGGGGGMWQGYSLTGCFKDT